MQAADDKKHTVKHNQSTLHRWSVWDSGSCLPCHGKATVLRQMAEGTGINWDSRGPGDCRVSIFEDPASKTTPVCQGWLSSVALVGVGDHRIPCSAWLGLL